MVLPAQECKTEFLRFDLEQAQTVVLSRANAERATEKILKTHSISRPMSAELANALRDGHLAGSATSKGKGARKNKGGRDEGHSSGSNKQQKGNQAENSPGAETTTEKGGGGNSIKQTSKSKKKKKSKRGNSKSAGKEDAAAEKTTPTQTQNVAKIESATPREPQSEPAPENGNFKAGAVVVDHGSVQL
eukprot:SAG31_NODE_436_length_15717_cov_5.420412_14_plen_189_part_00